MCQDCHIPEYAWTCWSYAAVLLERKANEDHLRAQELLEEAPKSRQTWGFHPYANGWMT